MMMEKPKCMNYEKCGQLAISLIYRKWVCGNCLTKFVIKVQEEGSKELALIE